MTLDDVKRAVLSYCNKEASAADKQTSRVRYMLHAGRKEGAEYVLDLLDKVE